MLPISAKDFLVACKVIDPEWATASLRELYKMEIDDPEKAQSVEAYVAEFTTYLRRTKPMSTGLSSMALELEAATPADTSSIPGGRSQ
jgi:hypothetical protein